nr:hypothetical protein [Tanacetum cinerariifolium]
MQESPTYYEEPRKNKLDKPAYQIRYVVLTGRYVVPTGRYVVPTGRCVVPTGRVIVATGRYVVPAGSDNESDDASVHNKATNTKQQPNIQPQIIITVSNNNAKFPYLKKDEYENAVKARFGGNAESKKIRKSILKQEFSEFRIGEAEGLHKGSGNVIKDVLQSFVTDTEPEQQLAYKDLEQIEKLDPEEMDLKWKMAMLSVRVHKFEQKAGRKIDFDKKESAMFNNKKVRCYKCQQRGHFARECRAKEGNDKQRYSSFKIKEIGKKEEDSKALITVDTLVDWTNHDSESDGVIAAKEFGMIAGCDSKDAIKEGAAKLYNLITGANLKEANIAGDAGEFALMGVTSEVTLEDKIRVLSIELENTSNLLKHSERINADVETTKKDLQTKLDNHLVKTKKWRNSSKNLFRLIDSSMSVRTKVGLGFTNCISENELGWNDSAFNVFTTNSEDVEGRPIFHRFTKTDSMKAVPPPFFRDYTSLSDHIDLDESQMSYGTKSSTSSDSKSVSNGFVSCDDSDKSLEVNTNDFASSDSSVKSSEPKPNDSTSCASTSSVSTSENEAEIKSNVKTPIQKPIIVQDSPSYSCNSSDKNENTSRTSCNKNGYFNKKAGHSRKNASSVSKLCFVCGSGTHLIKDCDFYEKQMANKTVSIRVGSIHSRNKVNHQTQFVPQVVLLRTGNVTILPVRPQPVPTGKPKVFVPVPAGRQNRPFLVPTDRGYSPLVSSGWWKSTARPMPHFSRPISSYFQHYTPYVPTMSYDHMKYGGDRWATPVKPSAVYLKWFSLFVFVLSVLIQGFLANDKLLEYVVLTGRYVVPTGRYVVPTGRYVVPTGRVIVATGRVLYHRSGHHNSELVADVGNLWNEYYKLELSMVRCLSLGGVAAKTRDKRKMWLDLWPRNGIKCMQTRSSSRLVSNPSSNPTPSTNSKPKGRNHRRSKQRIEEFNLDELSPPIVTMAQLLQAPTEGYEDAIVVLAITADNFELKYGLLTLVQNKQACPHHGFSELHQLDKFYNALNSKDQDSLNSVASGNFLDKMPREYLAIIEIKSKVCYSRNKPVVAKVSTYTSTSSISPDVAELKDMVKALLLDKKTTDGNVYRENIQEFVSQAFAVNYNQGNISYRPPMRNNQNRFNQNQNRENNFNHGPVYQPLVFQPPAYQAPAYQASAPQTQGVSKEDFSAYVKANDAVMRNMQTQCQNMQNQLTNLTDLLTKFLNSNNASTSSSGTLPSNTIVNPRSGGNKPEETKDTVHPTNNGSTEDVQPPVVQSKSLILTSEPVNSLTIEPVISPISALRPNLIPSIPYPSRMQDQKLRDKANDQRKKFFQIFKDLNFNISFVDALILMPKFGPSIKSLLTNKDKLCELSRTSLNEHCSAVLLKKLPEKLGDPDKFLIPCDFPGKAECLALADLNASINLMPLSVWNKLSLPNLSPTCMTLELANRAISHFDADPRVPLILERSFLKTERALIDVFEGELTLRVGKEAITFNLDQTSRYSANYSDMAAKRIYVIDMACEEYSQEVLGFFDVISSGNPTPYYDPIVSTTSLTLTPFGNSDFLLEEVDAFLTIEDDPTSSKVDQSYLNPEGDILLL